VVDRPVPRDTLFLGEVGLGGEVRPVAASDRRLAEAERLGFARAFVSARAKRQGGLETVPIAHVAELAQRLDA
jgi:DNA repair protein RadA/Sms